MLAKRIIPCLDVKGGRVVKGTRFLNLRDAGDPVEVAALYDEQGADELVFLDITASYERRAIMIDVVARTADQAFMPLTGRRRHPVAGGIRALLKAGRTRSRSIPRRWRSRTFSGVRRSDSAASASCWRSTRSDEPRAGLQKPGATSHDREPAKTERCSIMRGSQLAWEVYVHGGRTPTGRDAVSWAARKAQGLAPVRSSSPAWIGTAPKTATILS